jgi:hypothetical protein
MNKIISFLALKKAFLTITMVVIIGFALFGSYNIARSFSLLDRDGEAGDNTVSINTQTSVFINPDGNFCSPFGCAGCTGCINPEYRQISETVFAPVAELNQPL